MKRFIIIPSYIEGNILDTFAFQPEDQIFCADGGYEHAVRAGIHPDLVIGDFDSMQGSALPDTDSIRLPAEKDDTDTGVCIDHALAAGAEEIILLGGLGGRLDHTLGNLQLMCKVIDLGKRMAIIDQKNIVTLLKNNFAIVPKLEGFRLSLLSYSDFCYGLTVKGVLYPLKDATFTNKYPLGVSNEFVEDFAEISVTDGTLLIMLSKD